MRIDGEAELRIGCVCSDSERARVAFAEIQGRCQWAEPDDCDVLVALGGDGFLLHVMHRHLELARPIFGMNRGTVGFLLNQFKAEGLVERIAAATRIDVHPLAMQAVTTAGLWVPTTFLTSRDLHVLVDEAAASVTYSRSHVP